MATIKSYTDLSQSKKLAEILPLESADMHYPDYYFDGNAKGPCNTPYKEAIEDLLHVYINPKTKRLLPCWSLAALISVLPLEIDTHKQTDGYKIYYYVESYMKRMGKEIYLSTERHENLVDACVDMIESLHKQNIL